jgi:predicted regulator of Ras-like GTPase activity (Roadblock/LC7/MglB family)
MAGLPALIDEDVQRLDSVLRELLVRSESSIALIIDKGGPLISQCGVVASFDSTTVAALAAGSFCATQAIAERMGETTFSSIYQQGQQNSLLVTNIDEDLLLIVVFRAQLSVGLVKYYAAFAIAQVAAQLDQARRRTPDASTPDLVSMDALDVSGVFRKAE